MQPAAGHVHWLDASLPALPSEIVFPARTMLLVGGVPGAGKTFTLARCASPDTMTLDADAYRGAVQAERGLSPHIYDQDSVSEARRRFFSDLHDALRVGQDVIVDAALLKSRARQELAGLAYQYDYQPHMLIVSATLQQCLDGVTMRRRTVPADQVRDYHARFRALTRALREAGPGEQLVSVTVIDRAAAARLQQIRFGD